MADPTRLPSPQARAFAAGFRARELQRHRRTAAIWQAGEELGVLIAEAAQAGRNLLSDPHGLANSIILAYEHARAALEHQP